MLTTGCFKRRRRVGVASYHRRLCRATTAYSESISCTQPQTTYYGAKREGLTTLTEVSESTGGKSSWITSRLRSLAPRFDSTSARAVAPSPARRTGSLSNACSVSSSSSPDCTWQAPLAAKNVSATSLKFCIQGPKTIGLPKMAGSKMLCPPTSTRLPPTKTTVAIW